ncbi:cellulose biosynthesis cyclic di-GMP-binding regulatory protein BcsB [[Pseudomonas] boreopolis]|uniref:cellulose biosynthesis cyclic di-GMP-binding regulatory protein BcsB n=1 Tax=Xanthomonas boreopolis TaxID=86183 RepID=UPI003D9BC2A6
MSTHSYLRWLMLPLLALPAAQGSGAARIVVPPMPAAASLPDSAQAPPAPAPAGGADASPAGAPAGASVWTGGQWPWQRSSSFADLGRRQDVMLSGVRTTATYEFQVRRDRLVRQAELQLSFTPSPALLPTLSHLRVYLNDALMDVVPIAGDQLGRPVQANVPLDARLIADFNQVRLEFVGHYTDICEEPTHSSLWVNVSSASTLRLGGQPLAMQDDLANFPLPFFDPRDTARLELPVVFAGTPSLAQQRAAAVMASYFGAMAGWWRQARFPVSYDRLPDAGHAVVFAVNGRFPAFIAGHAPVQGPVVELASLPQDPQRKLLLVLGRNDEDLQTAVAAMASGNALFRGTRVSIDGVKELAPRKPYDAPNWVRTDRPVRLAELLDYPQQLRASGVSPQPITVNLNLPPDLFIWRNQGIPLSLRYRYTPPFSSDESRLSISINDQFISSFPLIRRSGKQGMDEIRLPVLSSDAGSGDGKLLIPALKLGDRNQLRFDFNFASVMGSAQRDHCQTVLPPNLQAAIEEDSTIDFSGFHHYMGLPDLSAFALSGFPFTRMADLSETVVLMPPKASAAQVGLLLDLIGGLGVQSGYPAYGLRVSDDWKQASALDADLLVLGALPDELRGSDKLSLLIENQRTVLLSGRTADPKAAVEAARQGNPQSDAAINRVAVSADAPFAAIIGLQSPRHAQRSIVSLAATHDADYALLDEALADIGKRQAIAGSVAILRSSGISSQFVGEHYFVGSLPWWLLLWYHLADHPALLAALAVLVVLMVAFLLWRALRWVSQRRLDPDRG